MEKETGAWEKTSERSSGKTSEKTSEKTLSRIVPRGYNPSQETLTAASVATCATDAALRSTVIMWLRR